MTEDVFDELTDGDEIDEPSYEEPRHVSEAELISMMVLYKNRLMMEAINQGLEAGFVGVCLLELAIPTLLVRIPREEVIEALEETITVLKDDQSFDDLSQDIEKLRQLYTLMNEPAQGTA